MSNVSLDDLMNDESRFDDPENKPTGRRIRTIISILVVCAIIVVLVVGVKKGYETLSSSMKPQVTVALDYPGPGSTPVDIVISQGDGGGVIAQTLVKAGVVGSTSAFTSAFAQTPGATNLQPGTYRLKKEMSGRQAVTALLAPANRIDQPLTVTEGETAEQVFAKIVKLSGQSDAEVRAAAADPAGLGVPQGQASPGVEGRQGTQIEGYLFPLTYRFVPKTPAKVMLTEMVNQTKKQLTDLKVPESAWLKTLTEASIVRKEGKLVEDLPKIARVLDNRIDEGMRLQLDSTVSYAHGDYSSVFTDDAQRADRSPFNTYQNDGLPPGPITNPDLASLKAALNPADGRWLYFVAVNLNTGETVFSETNSQHNAAVRQLQAWVAANPGNY